MENQVCRDGFCLQLMTALLFFEKFCFNSGCCKHIRRHKLKWLFRPCFETLLFYVQILLMLIYQVEKLLKKKGFLSESVFDLFGLDHYLEDLIIWSNMTKKQISRFVIEFEMDIASLENVGAEDVPGNFWHQKPCLDFSSLFCSNKTKQTRKCLFFILRCSLSFNSLTLNVWFMEHHKR